MNRQRITPEPGKIYILKSNNSIVTSMFRCVSSQAGTAVFQNVASGWTFTAHGVAQYYDGEIDWDFSTGGHFENIPIISKEAGNHAKETQTPEKIPF